MHILRGLTLAAALMVTACGETDPTPSMLNAGITISGHFGEDGEASYDLSGLACDWQSGAPDLRCLAIEDEGSAAQWARFDGEILRAEARIDLLGLGQALGTAPRNICANEDLTNRELDGEAAAFSDGSFYVTGSHGCSRSSDEYRPASFIVARITPDDMSGDFEPGTVAVAQSHRLTSLLRREPLLTDFFGASLQNANGLTIEGLAVQGERMTFGLRAPVVDGQAFLFETSITALFSREIAGPGRAVAIPLGSDIGIRDLAYLPDGRLLILSGPAQDQARPYRLHLHSPDGSIAMLSTIDAPIGGKAEAMAITGMEGETVSLLVLFDGLEDGAPVIVTVDLDG